MLVCFGVSFLTVRKVGFILQGDEIKEVHLEVTRGLHGCVMMVQNAIRIIYLPSLMGCAWSCHDS
jgi:hypothetical protein